MRCMRPQRNQYNEGQQGFTLIELMISLVLGLLISAAVIQVFITSQRVDRIQAAGSEIQDSAVFGLQAIEYQLRLTNLGNGGVPLNDTTAKGGVILTVGKEDAANVNAAVKGGDEASSYVTRTVIDGFSNTKTASDQLTIQYINTTGLDLFDCEGQKVEPNKHVIMRYFVIEDSVKTGKERKNLNLNCDAGFINSNDEPENFLGNGQTIIKNIDQFNIRLGVKIPDNTGAQVTYEYSDLTVDEYMALTGTKPYITNIKLAVLTRSNANSPDATEGPFKIFGIDQTLKTQADAPKYLRRVYTTNTLLRNARIVNIIRTDPSAPTS